MLSLNLKALITLLIIWLGLSCLFYLDLSALLGQNLKQFLVVAVFTLAGGLAPVFELLFFASERSFSAILGYRVTVSFLCFCCMFPYTKRKNCSGQFYVTTTLRSVKEKLSL